MPKRKHPTKLAVFFACFLFAGYVSYFPLAAKAQESSHNASAPAPTVAQLQEQIRSLLIILQGLQARVDALRGAPAGSAPSPLNASSPIILRGFISTFPRDLSFGMQGEEVKELQRFLKLQGYGITEDFPDEDSPGSYQTGTREAVRQFQKDNNLPQTGYFGPMTRRLVNNMVTAN
jgi:hypothetical protein